MTNLLKIYYFVSDLYEFPSHALYSFPEDMLIALACDTDHVIHFALTLFQITPPVCKSITTFVQGEWTSTKITQHQTQTHTMH